MSQIHLQRLTSPIALPGVQKLLKTKLTWAQCRALRIAASYLAARYSASRTQLQRRIASGGLSSIK
jgi:hypothetical protein